MSAFVTTFKLELRRYFVTPLAWVAIAAFLLVQGWHFALVIEHIASAPSGVEPGSAVALFFGNTVLLYLVTFLFLPPLTMRLLAAERSQGTDELWMSAPIRMRDVVLGKFAAVGVVYVTMWAPTVLYMLVLARVQPLDAGQVAAAYLGVTLIGAWHLAMGVWASSVTRSQFIAAIVFACFILGFFFLGMLEFVLPVGTNLYALARLASVWAAMTEFAAGVVDLRRVVWMLSLVVFFLALAARQTESWRNG